MRPDERAVHDRGPGLDDRPSGREVVTYAWGDGARPVLLVHGWAARASRFADLVTALLADGWSPVAYDAWAHGATRGPARTMPDHQVVIAELAERYGPFEGVVAHSFGVPVTLYAARHGLAADRLVAISGMGDFGSLVDTFCLRLGRGAGGRTASCVGPSSAGGSTATPGSGTGSPHTPHLVGTCSSCTTPATGSWTAPRPIW